MSQRAPSTFEIYPAIDLRAGHVVRLRQGDFAREQVYDDDPVRVARAFAAAGARWIHVVDLDGARDGARRQAPAVTAIAAVAAVAGIRTQVAGGLRTREAIDDVLAAGVERVVIGTAALRDPSLVQEAIARHGAARIAIALDVRDGLAIGEGWVARASGVPVNDAIDILTTAGVGTFIVTAIERDGLLGGPDLALLEQAIARTAATIVASGGVATLGDLEAARAIGCAGAVVGRAIYDGRIDLAEAIAVTRTGRPTRPSTSR